MAGTSAREPVVILASEQAYLALSDLEHDALQVRTPIAGVVSNPGALQEQAQQPMGRLQGLRQGLRLGRLEQGWALG